MNIVMVGGGNVGVIIARKLISENHNVTIIEENEQVVQNLQNSLDAMIITGSGIDIDVLNHANIKNASLFLAVTNDDRINLITSKLARKLSNEDTIIIAKLENAYLFFDNELIKPEDFGINSIIDLKQLSIDKISTLIEHPEAIEIIDYYKENIQLIGIKIYENFQYLDKTLKEIGMACDLFKNTRVVAINRNARIIIPAGYNKIHIGDKIYLIGAAEIIQKIKKKYFDPKIKLSNIIIIDGNTRAKELANHLVKKNRKVTIIESDHQKCQILSRELKNVTVMQGTGTDINVVNEADIKKSCFVAITKNNEYNLMSAVFAKNHEAAKTICMISNIELVPIIHTLPAIDVTFSPHLLAAGEILRICRKGNIISVTPFSEINAETINFLISENIDILEKPLEEIKFPDGMIIGVIIRDNQIIIPTGKDKIKLYDKVIVFILPSSFAAAGKIFTKKSF